MHIKIQGGGDGKYANTGSCSSLVSYLEHEDLERIKEGREIEPFFSHADFVGGSAIIDAIDNNKKKLCKVDSKFFMLTYSPSKEELVHLGTTEREQSIKLRDFVRKGLMQQYAENFNKGLNAEDLMYYAKIHHQRKTNKEEGNLHIHVIVSRKTLDGRLKISPQTNHKNTIEGAVKGGFVRTIFFNNSEKAFDKHFLYQRRMEEQFDYKKQYKKANPLELIQLIQLKNTYNRNLFEKALQIASSKAQNIDDEPRNKKRRSI